MNLKEYFAKKGSRFSDKDAQIIGPELERLGAAKAGDIVEAARPDTSPLHMYFEWDDEIAAEEYRKSQARNMANSIVVKVADREGEQREVRAFHAVKIEKEMSGEDNKQYVSVNRIFSDKELYEQVMNEAISALLSWKKKYETYRSVFVSFEKEFGTMFTLINELDRKVS